MSQDSIVAFVSSLFFACGPLAISRPAIRYAFLTFATGIMTVIVDPVYRAFFWTDTHIGNEIIETSPMLANLDASFSISFVRLIVFPQASTNHGVPRFPCRAIAQSMRRTCFECHTRWRTETDIFRSWLKKFLAIFTRFHRRDRMYGSYVRAFLSRSSLARIRLRASTRAGFVYCMESR